MALVSLFLCIFQSFLCSFVPFLIPFLVKYKDRVNNPSRWQKIRMFYSSPRNVFRHNIVSNNLRFPLFHGSICKVNKSSIPMLEIRKIANINTKEHVYIIIMFGLTDLLWVCEWSGLLVSHWYADFTLVTKTELHGRNALCFLLTHDRAKIIGLVKMKIFLGIGPCNINTQKTVCKYAQKI